jgi:hypothetical protein
MFAPCEARNHSNGANSDNIISERQLFKMFADDDRATRYEIAFALHGINSQGARTVMTFGIRRGVTLGPRANRWWRI